MKKGVFVCSKIWLNWSRYIDLTCLKLHINSEVIVLDHFLRIELPKAYKVAIWRVYFHFCLLLRIWLGRFVYLSSYQKRTPLWFQYLKHMAPSHHRLYQLCTQLACLDFCKMEGSGLQGPRSTMSFWFLYLSRIHKLCPFSIDTPLQL